jgi:hypothetical protein
MEEKASGEFVVGEGKIGGDVVWGVMDGLLVTEVFVLADGRIEVNWLPVDRAIPEEIEYLSDRTDLPVHRTQMQSILRDASVHYLFSPDNLWRGIRCSKEFWCLFMRAKGWLDANVDEFIKDLERAPKKKITPMGL